MTTPPSWAAGLDIAYPIRNIRQVAQMRTGHTPSRTKHEYWEDVSIPWFTLADVWQLRNDQKYLGGTKELISPLGLANSAAELLPTGTVVLSRTASVGFTGIMPAPMATSQDFWNWVCGPEMLPVFLWYQLRAMRPEFDRLKSGSTHKTIYQGDAAGLRVVVPPIEAQRRITDYLDHETAEIDAFIADLVQLRSQLEERWSSALVEIVQGRSHRDAVDTGVDVWPLAPSTWSRTRLKSTVAASTNGMWGDEPTDSTGTRCIRVADFDKVRGKVHDLNPTWRLYDASATSRMALRPGDLILEKSGGGPTSPVGNVVRYTGEGGDMYSNFVARIQVADHVDSEYSLRLHQCLYAGGVTARSVKQTTGIQNLDESAYFDEPVFLPGLTEQKAIASVLETERRATDDTNTDIDAAISLAKERRAALITAAVTGQIDVTAKQKPVVDSIQAAIEESR